MLSTDLNKQRCMKDKLDKINTRTEIQSEFARKMSLKIQHTKSLSA